MLPKVEFAQRERIGNRGTTLQRRSLDSTLRQNGAQQDESS